MVYSKGKRKYSFQVRGGFLLSKFQLVKNRGIILSVFLAKRCFTEKSVGLGERMS